jgi:cytoskeleton protein RodZ
VSAMPVDNENRPAGPGDEHGGDTVVAGDPVVVRRHAGLAALVGAAASAVAIAYLWRASLMMTPLDWTLCAVMAGIAGTYLASLVDARTPLVVADDLGVRIRLGNEWRGLPWDAIGEVAVHPRRGFLRDGRLVFAPHSLARALDGLDARGRRHARANQRMYGGALAVPLGLTTRVSVGERGGGISLADALAALALGRADVVEFPGGPAEDQPSSSQPSAPSPAETSEDPAGDRGAQKQKALRTQNAEPEEKAQKQTAQQEQKSPEGRQRALDPVAASPVDRSSAPRDRHPAGGADRSASPEQQPAAAPVVSPQSEDRGRTQAGAGRDGRDGRVATAQPEQPEAALTETATTPVSALTGRGPLRSRRSVLGGIGTIVSRVAKGRRRDVDHVPQEPAVEAEAPTGPATPAAAALPGPRATLPLRETRRGSRAEVTRDIPATLGNAALHEDLAEEDERQGSRPGRDLRRPGSVDLVFEPADSGRVRPISTLGDPVEPLVIDDFVTEPAYDPVIGPEITAARTRLGLSVDELAERTRIRPHVIESIEVDDFKPCGGDFYARGHLRTLARVLGKDVTPMLAQFEERYATAPINARRVFEAELATGMTGSMRSTVGGPNWGLLAGVVLSLVLVWGVVRLFAAEPAEIVDTTAPVLNGSAGVGDSPVVPAPAGPAVEPLEVRLTATQVDTVAQVRDGNGEVVFRGPLVLGERRTVQAAPPVRVRAVDGSSIEVTVNGKDRGPLGTVVGEPARRTFHGPGEPE